MMYIFSQIIGVIGIAANFIIYQQTKRKRLLITKLISDIIWATHYMSLGAFSAMAIACIGAVREIAFYICYKKKRQPKLLLILFMLVSITAGVLTWKSAASLLPVFASCTAIFSFWQSKPSTTHRLSIVVSIFMLSYDLSVISIAGIANELCTMTSSISTIIKENRKARHSC